MADKLLLLRRTTVWTIHGFMERQSPTVAGNYHELCRALRAEYTMHQNPSAIRLCKIVMSLPESIMNAYTECILLVQILPRAEENMMFKSLFVSNLHPTIRKPLALLVDVDHMTAAELRQLGMWAWENE